MTIPLETRKRVLEALGFVIKYEQKNECWRTLLRNKPYWCGENPGMFESEQAAWESVALDANLCEREVLPYMRKQHLQFHTTVINDNIIAVFQQRGLGYYDAEAPLLSTAIILAFDSYLKANQ